MAADRALKFAVVGMGVLIVLGLVVVFATIAKRMTAGKSPEATPAAEIAAPKPAVAFGDTLVSIPRGGRMVDFRSDGNRLLIHVRPPGLEDVIHVIDLATGKALGTVTVAPRPQ
jgi:hypothetical protein